MTTLFRVPQHTHKVFELFLILSLVLYKYLKKIISISKVWCIKELI